MRLRRPLGRAPLFPRIYVTSSVRSDRHLEVLGGTEGDLLARLDLNGLAGRRIAAHAGGALSHLKDAEPGDLHPLALVASKN